MRAFRGQQHPDFVTHAASYLTPQHAPDRLDGPACGVRDRVLHITLVTYAHAIPKQRQGAGDALARLMAESANKMETSVA